MEAGHEQGLRQRELADLSRFWCDFRLCAILINSVYDGPATWGSPV